MIGWIFVSLIIVVTIGMYVVAIVGDNIRACKRRKGSVAKISKPDPKDKFRQSAEARPGLSEILDERSD